MIDALSQFFSDIAWVIRDVGARLSLNAYEVTQNQYLGGKDYKAIKECEDWARYCRLVWEGQMGKEPGTCPNDPYTSWCPTCTWDCFNNDLNPAEVLGNLAGFTWMYKGGELITDIGAIIDSHACPINEQ